MGIQRGQGLKHHPSVTHGVQHTTAIYVQPHADVHRVARLAHEYSIALFLCNDPLPTLALGVAVEGVKYSAQVGGVHGVFWERAVEVAALHCDEQAPAIKGIRTSGADHPRQPNQAGEIFNPDGTHRVSPGNSRAV
jgi:hypothetical protein